MFLSRFMRGLQVWDWIGRPVQRGLMKAVLLDV